MLFWNIADINNKDKEFWEYVNDFDFISLSETWLEQEGWIKLKNKLPDSHIWECKYAKKIKKKGKAKEGFIIGIRKGWGEK